MSFLIFKATLAQFLTAFFLVSITRDTRHLQTAFASNCLQHDISIFLIGLVTGIFNIPQKVLKALCSRAKYCRNLFDVKYYFFKFAISSENTIFLHRTRLGGEAASVSTAVCQDILQSG